MAFVVFDQLKQKVMKVRASHGRANKDAIRLNQAFKTEDRFIVQVVY